MKEKGKTKSFKRRVPQTELVMKMSLFKRSSQRK